MLIELLHSSWEWYQLLPPTPPGASGVPWVPLGAFLGASWVTSKPSKLVRSLRDSSENIRRSLRDSSENTRTLYYVVSLWNTIIIRKNENPGLTEKSRFWWEISSQIHFSTENLISSYGHDEHFGKAVCPKPILKVWFWMKTFLCQCKKLTQRRFFPKSRFWDVGMEFRDVGCVRISFAMNSNLFSTHSNWKSIKSYWNRPKIHILAMNWDQKLVK